MNALTGNQNNGGMKTLMSECDTYINNLLELSYTAGIMRQPVCNFLNYIAEKLDVINEEPAISDAQLADVRSVVDELRMQTMYFHKQNIGRPSDMHSHDHEMMYQ